MSDRVKVEIVGTHIQRLTVSYDSARDLLAHYLREGYVALVDSPTQMTPAPLTSAKQLPPDATDVWLFARGLRRQAPLG